MTVDNWIKSLNPGDLVILVSGWWDDPIDVLAVEAVTPSGIVRTSGGDFRKNSHGNVTGLGFTTGKIKPYAEDLAKQARAHAEQQRREAEKARTIQRARDLCFCLSRQEGRMTEKLAREILAIVERAEA